MDEVDEDDGVAHHDAGQGDHADHGGGGEIDGVGVTFDVAGKEQVQQGKPRHHPDHGERDGHHDHQGHGIRRGLQDQQDVDADEGPGEGYP